MVNLPLLDLVLYLVQQLHSHQVVHFLLFLLLLVYLLQLLLILILFLTHLSSFLLFYFQVLDIAVAHCSQLSVMLSAD